MIHLQLSKGYTTVIDEVDADLAAFKWCAQVNIRKDHVLVYAHRNAWLPEAKKYKKTYLHAVIAKRMGIVPPMRPDHIDKDTLNNLRSNLRALTNGHNIMSRHEARGVYYHKQSGRWVAEADKYLGIFPTREEALARRIAYEKELGL